MQSKFLPSLIKKEWQVVFSATGTFDTKYRIISIGHDTDNNLVIHLDYENSENNPMAWLATGLGNLAGRMWVGGNSPYIVFDTNGKGLGYNLFFVATAEIKFLWQLQDGGGYLFDCRGNGVGAKLTLVPS